MPVVSTHRTGSDRIAGFKESVIREMTRLALEHGAVNLAQGFPDFAAPAAVKTAAHEAIDAEANQYSVTWGMPAFREAISRYYQRFYSIEIDPQREITVSCGATEGMVATLLALLNPGDEVVVFEPFYENYWPDSLLSGAVCRYVTLQPPEWTFDLSELRAAFNERTRAVIVNSPHNPTGRVFTREELTAVSDLCREFDSFLITDEIYEHIVFDGAGHIPPITLPGLRERCILVNSLSKTFSVTGWRVGWVIAPPDLTPSIRKVHDFLTVNAPSPLQQAGITALGLPDPYFAQLETDYTQRRDLLLGILNRCGLRPFTPRGAYYILCDIGAFGFGDDVEFCLHLLRDGGVAAVPGSSFFSKGTGGAQLIRFCFAKKRETLEAAGERLERLLI